MKILQVIPYFCFGGAETMCENLTYALKAMGHEVQVVSLYNDRTPIAARMEEAGVQIIYLDKKLGLDVSMVGKLRKIMMQFQPDVVHTHLNIIKYAALAAKLAGVKRCVHTVHNVADKEAESRSQMLINGTYFRLGWSVPVALSPLVKQSILDFYNLKDAPMVYNGVDLSRCMQKTDYSLHGPTLIHVGRFNEQKNHECVLAAFQIILKAYPDATLKLLGDGERMEEIKKLAAAMGIAQRVIFVGSTTDVYPYLQEADVFMLPSKYEGMPMTVIEAMGTGLPIVASNVGGLSDMIDDGRSGFLVDVDAKATAEAVLKLLQSQSLRESFGREAKADSNQFSAQTMAEEYLKLYQ